MSDTASLSWASSAQRRRVVSAMRRTEGRLEQVAKAGPGDLGRLASSTLHAGGKRLRPLLVILSSRSQGPLPAGTVRAAAAVELLHMATLVHDDVLDDADLRRGRPTVVSEAGVGAATSVGNYLFAGAFAEVTATGSAEAVSRLSAVAAGLSEGERLQSLGAHRVDLGIDEYLTRCMLKTAGLFGAACALGAVVSHLAPTTVEALDGYGRSLGLAFQIFDDILDLTGEPAQTGKCIGADIRDGTLTLPLLLAIEERPSLAEALQLRHKARETVDRIVCEVRETNALERARQVALENITAARARLHAHCESVMADLLHQIAGQVVDRYS